MRTAGIIALGDADSGGVFQYTQSIIDALTKLNDTKYIVFTNHDDNRFDNYGLEIRKINRPKGFELRNLLNLTLLAGQIKIPLFIPNSENQKFKDIDLFICPAISAYPHYFLNKPFIFTFHDMQERYYPEFFTLKERWMRRLLNRALANSSSAIICESNYVKNDIIKFTRATPENIHVIPSPPPSNFLKYSFSEDRALTIRQKYHLPNKYLFYPAQCWYHKNHINLLEAFNIAKAKVPDLQLVLTGSQRNNYPQLVKRVSELNLKNSVKHLGYIDYEDLPYLYKMSQMLVMPSLFESVSIPIYEAFILGAPVCSSNVVALPEQVGDAGLTFDPLNPTDMAEKILSLLNNETLAKTFVQRGKQKVEGFNHNLYSEKLHQVMQTLLK